MAKESEENPQLNTFSLLRLSISLKSSFTDLILIDDSLLVWFTESIKLTKTLSEHSSETKACFKSQVSSFSYLKKSVIAFRDQAVEMLILKLNRGDAVKNCCS